MTPEAGTGTRSSTAAGGRLQGLAPLLALSPPLMAVSPATVGVFVPLYTLLWLFFKPQRSQFLRAAGSPFSLLMLATVALGGVSSLWAVDAALALEKALKFGLVCLPPLWALNLLVEEDLNRERAARLFLWGMAIATALLASQTFGDLVLRDLVLDRITPRAEIKTNVPAAALAILAWALPLATTKLSPKLCRVAFVVLAAIGLCAFAGDGLAPPLSFVAGAACFGLARRAPAVCAVLIACGLIGVQLAAPRLHALPLAQHVERSVQHRMDLWALAGELSAQRPWQGFGFSNSGAIPTQPGQMALTGLPREFPLYPHNILLQVQLELGVPGVLLFYAALLVLLREAGRFTMPARCSALALLGSALGVWLVGYPLWRSAWVGWLLYGALAHRLLATAEPPAAAKDPSSD